VGRLVAVGHGIWIDEPERTLDAPQRFRSESVVLKPVGFNKPYLSTTISCKTRWSTAHTLPARGRSDNPENSRGQTPARFRFYLDALSDCLCLPWMAD